jgi:GDSL-like Lipase/Acylhydrolase family/Putative Ig domain
MKRVALILLLCTCCRQKVFLQTMPGSKLQFTSKEKNRVSIDSMYYYQFSAIDSTGKPVSYAVAGLPQWLHFNRAGHSIAGKPARPGQYLVDIAASTLDTTVHERFMLTVYDHRTMNILALGNSITNGTSTYNSYRRALWQMLHAGNYDFDFIGSWSLHHMGGPVPDPDFDMDHDGHSGWTTRDIVFPPAWDSMRGNLNQWIRGYTPGIVLIELGTNDVFQCVPADESMKNIDSIIDILRSKNPRVNIFVAQVPPLGAQWADKKLCGTDIPYSRSIQVFNEHVVKMAAEKNLANSAVIAVDLYSGVHPSTDMYDDIHPNTKGEKDMAQRWFDAIRSHLVKLGN